MIAAAKSAHCHGFIKRLRQSKLCRVFPEECIPLAIVRPISGSGALACLETILSSVSPDSYSGRVASVLMGSTETTFYTIAVYFSAIKQKAYPSVFAAACLSDAMGFVFSALAVRLFFS